MVGSIPSLGHVVFDGGLVISIMLTLCVGLVVATLVTWLWFKWINTQCMMHQHIELSLQQQHTHRIVHQNIELSLQHRQQRQQQQQQQRRQQQQQQQQRLNLSSQENKMEPSRAHTQCPICLDNLHFAVETNCGHLFCTTCVMSYYEHGTFVAAMNCPVCRQLVHVLLVNYTHEEEVDDQVETHLRKIRGYNSRFSGEPRPIMDYVYDVPLCTRWFLGKLLSIFLRIENCLEEIFNL